MASPYGRQFQPPSPQGQRPGSRSPHGSRSRSQSPAPPAWYGGGVDHAVPTDLTGVGLCGVQAEIEGALMGFPAGQHVTLQAPNVRSVNVGREDAAFFRGLIDYMAREAGGMRSRTPSPASLPLRGVCYPPPVLSHPPSRPTSRGPHHSPSQQGHGPPALNRQHDGLERGMLNLNLGAGPPDAPRGRSPGVPANWRPNPAGRTA